MHLDNYQRRHRNVGQRQGATLARLRVGHPNRRSQARFHYLYALLLHGYQKIAPIHTQSNEVSLFLKKRVVTKYCVHVRKATLQEDSVVMA